MPTPTAVKLLLDESPHDGDEEISNWTLSASPSRPPQQARPYSARRPRCSPFCALFIVGALIAMIIGALVGAFLLPQLIASSNWTLSASPSRPPQQARPYSARRPRCSPFCALFIVGALIAMIIGALVGAFLLPQLIASSECQLQSVIISQKTQSEEPRIEQRITEECGELYPWRSIRLPEKIRPLTYKLRLHPNLTTSTLSGSVQIELKVVKPTKAIVLHALDLNLTSYELNISGLHVSAHHSECEKLGQWAFELERELKETDNVSLSIDYEGLIHNDLSALYTNVHIADNGKKIVSAVTQFEPTHARRMLPCFDEPVYKATFEVAVIRQSSHIVRANMHLTRTEPYADGLFIDHFAPSVKMSTYLLAIAVLNEFKRVRKMTRNTVSTVEINLFAPADVSNQTDFGLTTGVLAMEFFESYFALPYPLQKLDMIALDDFAEGAMENWGMTTFRDAMLLHNSAASTTKSKETAALVVCHEYAHQWFGNLVTMKWWNDLWLNEGFANFMEYLCVEEIYPDWKVMDDFYVENYVMSMLLDGFDTSHAVSTTVDDPAQIGSIFDAISYQKGASIIGMIMGLAGKENFKKSLREYLKTYAYSNAGGEDLWRTIEKHSSLKAANVSVMQIAEAWTTRVGYPFITASMDANRSSIIIHNQTRFLFLEASRKENRSIEWPIPVHYRTDYSDAVNWFGNLVTMKWWNDLWLNEGFANFMEYLCVEEIYPDWKVWFGNLVTMKWWNDLWLNEGFANFMEYLCVEEIYPDWKVWFGNLVTMKWWNDLWLNEGFANFMEYLCVEEIYPDWKVMDDFYVENYVMSMLLDGFDTSHAVSTTVDDPAQIGSIFDAISYQKGASIIGMIMGLAGKENFKKSLREYLKTYAYSNAGGEDLWRTIEKHSSLKAANVSVMQIAEAWTTRVGYPFITASMDANRSSIIIHNQTRFLFLEASRKENRSIEWPIPVHYRTDYSDAVNVSWIKPGEHDVRITLEKPAKWAIVNARSLGYLRVLYEQNIYTEFVKQLKENHQVFSAVDRASIINDAFSFAKAGFIPIGTAMELVQYVEVGEETQRIPWNVIMGHLKSVESCIFESEYLDLFQEFMRSLLVPTYQRLGWSHKEDHIERLLQTEILAVACKLQIDDCSRQATRRFYQWTRDSNSVPVDLQPLVIEEGIRRGSPIDWERVYQEYLKASNPSQKFMLLAALSATRDIRLIYRFMNMCLKSSIVRPNLLPKALALLMQNPAAQLHTWRFFRLRFQHFDQTIGSTTTMLGMTIKSIIENFNTQFDLDQTLQFFEGKQLGASQAKVDQALDSIRVNIQWRRLNEKALGKWLHQWNDNRSLQ
ncbi:Endoplasmic reticulum aminopeptidase 1 [Toxocara canis]|uniref:Endoplasmic reticulum aminopeptidase 1 n=1 Tax=Toxocara canis TaxID=6265 RepID=A0A0B2VDQ3_TOXCA|nr:Endoplasmic reticulum aminopeptidase 1 [Toxocara canis]